jgi:uncharacterized protein (TIGR00255 family)
MANLQSGKPLPQYTPQAGEILQRQGFHPVSSADKLLHSFPRQPHRNRPIEMIHSMTAFARESTGTKGGVLTVELRSVNHRYLDCGFKLPDALRPLEPKLREWAAKSLARGKLDCYFRLQTAPGSGGDLTVNPAQLDKVIAAARLVQERMGQTAALDPLEILRFPGVYEMAEESEEALQQEAGDLFRAALKSLGKHRRREGDKLAALVLDRLDQVAAEVDAIREQLPLLRQQQRDRITARIGELGIELDHNRLEQELVHLAQKTDVDEEIDRLAAHVGEVRRTLEKGGPCGRRLDFLMQELNREANTLSAKSTSHSTTQNAVELKVLIEQMREQIQNIE